MASAPLVTRRLQEPSPYRRAVVRKAERGGFGSCITSRQSASARIQRSYRRGTRPDRNRVRCSVRHGHRCLCGTSPDASCPRGVAGEGGGTLLHLPRSSPVRKTADCPAGATGSFPTGRSAASPTRMIRRGVHKSVQALETSIRAWIENWKQDPPPFTWTKSAEEILGSLAKYIPTSGTGH